MKTIRTTIKEVLGISEEQTIRQYFSDPIVVQTLLKMLTIFAIAGGILLYTSIEIKESAFFSRDVVFSWLHWFGPWAWVLYIVLLIIAVMSPLPDALVIVAGGFFFGPVIGSLLTVIGQGLGSTIDFLLARKLGRNFVKAKFSKSSSFIDRYSEKLGWQTVFIMRLFPTVSFDMLSYVAGVSKLSFRRYIFATVSGMIPLAVVTTMLGHSVNIHSSRLALLSVGIGILSIITISVIFFLISLYKRRSVLQSK